MKKVGDIMAELGFREEGSDSVKRAFIENLVRAAGGDKYRPTPSPLASVSSPRKGSKATAREEQLSFDFSKAGEIECESGPETPFPFEQKRPAG